MAMRMGMSVGSTTDASSLSDQVKRYKLREFKESDAGDYQQPPKGGPERPPNPAHEALTDKCIKVVVDNFAERPVHEAVPAKHMREITARLPVEMDPTVTAVYVFDEVRAAPFTAALRSSLDHAAATPSCPPTTTTTTKAPAAATAIIFVFAHDQLDCGLPELLEAVLHRAVRLAELPDRRARADMEAAIFRDVPSGAAGGTRGRGRGRPDRLARMRDGMPGLHFHLDHPRAEVALGY
mmetsp:Transcript_71762/g.203041  ORF Transcript_71762/g.203041 Transcript_71762/m.203041 type:complete len:238 (+) Transcript_71762:259-972(+)